MADGQEPDTRRRRAGRAGPRPRSLVGQGLRRRRSGGRAVKDSVLAWGDLALRLKGRSGLTDWRAEKSADVVVARTIQGEGPNGRENGSSMDLEGKRPQMVRQLTLPFESRGKTPRVRRSEEEPPAVRANKRSGCRVVWQGGREIFTAPYAIRMVRSARIERATPSSGGWCSIH